MMKTEIVASKIDVLGEGPIWDSKNQKVIWVDIKGKRYHTINIESGQIKTFDSIGMISSIVTTDKNYMAATIDHGFYLIDDEGDHTLLSSVGSIGDGTRFNDGKADPFGHYIAGTMDLNENRQLGNLYCLSGKSVNIILRNLTVSNGIAWDTKKEIFYHIDTPQRKVNAYAYDRSMNLQKIGVAADFKELPGNPDGMTIDADGKIWVAHRGGGRISVFDPENGKRVEEILFPAANITSCAFAGNDLMDLYVTSAASGEPEDVGGSLFVVHTDVPGGQTYQLHVE